MILLQAAIVVATVIATPAADLERWLASSAENLFSREAVRSAKRIQKRGDCAIELAAPRHGAPQKISMRCRFATRGEGVQFLQKLTDSLRMSPTPSLKLADGGWTLREATFIRRGHAIGIEAHLFSDETSYVAALVLIDRGPRVVVKLK